MTFTMEAPTAPPALGMDLTYIIGEPGAGKSMLAEYLTRGIPCRHADKPFAHRLYANGVYELGERRSRFPGTDALSMAVLPVVLQWLRTRRPFKVIAEGDRLGNQAFFNDVEQLGYKVRLYVLWGPEVAAQHRALRGSEQDPSWVQSRVSKVRNLMVARAHQELVAGDPLKDLERQMWLMNDPVIRAMVDTRGQ